MLLVSWGPNSSLYFIIAYNIKLKSGTHIVPFTLTLLRKIKEHIVKNCLKISRLEIIVGDDACVLFTKKPTYPTTL